MLPLAALFPFMNYGMQQEVKYHAAEVKHQAETKLIAAGLDKVNTWIDKDPVIALKFKAEVATSVAAFKHGLKSAITELFVGQDKASQASVADCKIAIENLAALVRPGLPGQSQVNRDIAVPFQNGLTYIVNQLNALTDVPAERVKALQHIHEFSHHLFAAVRQIDDRIKPLNDAVAKIWQCLEEQERAILQAAHEQQSKRGIQQAPSVSRGAAIRFVIGGIWDNILTPKNNHDWALTDGQKKEIYELLVALDKVVTELSVASSSGRVKDLAITIQLSTREIQNREAAVWVYGKNDVKSQFIRDNLEKVEKALNEINTALIGEKVQAARDHLEKREAEVKMVCDLFAQKRFDLNLVADSFDLAAQGVAGFFVNIFSGMEAVVGKGAQLNAGLQGTFDRFSKLVAEPKNKKILEALHNGYSKVKTNQELITFVVENLKKVQLDDPRLLVDFVQNVILEDPMIITLLQNLAPGMAAKIEQAKNGLKSNEDAIIIISDVLNTFGMSESWAKVSKLAFRHANRLEQGLIGVRAMTEAGLPERALQGAAGALAAQQPLLTTVQSVLGGLAHKGAQVAINSATYAQAFDAIARTSLEIDALYPMPVQQAVVDRPVPVAQPVGYGLGLQPGVQPARPDEAKAAADAKAAVEAALAATMRDTKQLYDEQEKSYQDTLVATPETQREQAVLRLQQAVDRAAGEERIATAQRTEFTERADRWSSWWRLGLGRVYRWVRASSYDRSVATATAVNVAVNNELKLAENRLQEVYTAQQQRAEKLRAALVTTAVQAPELANAFAWAKESRALTMMNQRAGSLATEIGSLEAAQRLAQANYRTEGWGPKSWFNWIRRGISSRYTDLMREYTQKLAYLREAQTALNTQRTAFQKLVADKQAAVAALKGKNTLPQLRRLSPLFSDTLILAV